MGELQYIEGIIPYFTSRELYLINKYPNDFLKSVNHYQVQNLENLIGLFLKYGCKKFKTKFEKIEYLAIYQSILNHIEMLPTEEITMELMSKMSELCCGDVENVEKIFNDIAQEKKAKSIISIVNDELLNEDEGKFLDKHIDLKFKWHCITDRQEETFEWLKDSTVGVAREQLESLQEKFGKDVKFSFGSMDDEYDEDSIVEYVKEPERSPKEVNNDPMYS